MRKSFAVIPLLICLLAFGMVGCSLFQDEFDEDFYKEDNWEDQGGASSKEVEDATSKIEDISKQVKDSQDRVSMLEDSVDDLQYRVKKELDDLKGLKRKMAEGGAGGAGFQEEKRELERKINLLEKDIEWLKLLNKK